jgi:hypothetical protein
MLGSNHVLGIAVTDRLIACAEVSGRGEKTSVRHAATFALPAELSLDKPQPLGAALAAFLKEQGFSASNVVVGVPAKWLVAVEKDIPPAGREQTRALLRLQAERLPLAEGGELVFDYVGEHATDKAGKVLLVAMQKKQLDRIEQIAKAAGLSIVAVTPTALALANAAAGSRGVAGRANSPMLMLGRHGAEVVWQRQGTPRMLKHFGITATNGHGAPAMGPLSLELRRAVATAATIAPANGQAEPGSTASDMVLWDSIGLEPSAVQELSEKLGVTVHSNDGLAMLGVQAPAKSPAGSKPGHFAPALALAMSGANRALLPFDFTRSRLAPPPVRRFGRKAVWATVIGILVFGYIGFLVYDVYITQQGRLDEITQERGVKMPDRVAAQAIKDRVEFSDTYLRTRMPMLDCLRELTLTFGQEEPIWLTEYSITEDREGKDIGRAKVKIEGRASSANYAVGLAVRLRANPRFTSVNGPSMTTSGGGGSRGSQQRDQAQFSITFFYTPPPAMPPGPTPGTPGVGTNNTANSAGSASVNR